MTISVCKDGPLLRPFHSAKRSLYYDDFTMYEYMKFMVFNVLALKQIESVSNNDTGLQE